MLEVSRKSVHLAMYRSDPKQTDFIDFYMPFSGRLSPQNRWVKLAQMIPWSEVEECYKKSLDGTKMGAPAKSARIAFGALIIKERLGCSDEEVVEAILENPYLQHFLGLQEFRDTPLFDPSMMVHFRARFKQADHEIINAKIIALATDSGSQEVKSPAPQDSEPASKDE